MPDKGKGVFFAPIQGVFAKRATTTSSAQVKRSEGARAPVNLVFERPHLAPKSREGTPKGSLRDGRALRQSPTPQENLNTHFWIASERRRGGAASDEQDNGVGGMPVRRGEGRQAL